MQTNKDEAIKRDQEKERRVKEWDADKRRMRNELKSKAEYEVWVKKEKELRIKQDKKRRRRRVRELRKLYLDGEEDKKFQMS